jgi:pyruvate,water dikinase
MITNQDGEPQPTTATRVQTLDNVGADEPARYGTKATRLAIARRAGLPVPPGVVLPADLPDADIDGAVGSALPVLGADAVAVRSSASAEDLADASFAGMYDTSLNVRGIEAVAAAVRKCRSSGAVPRVRRYRADTAAAAMPAGAVEPIAVLIQPMIEADAAGVAFTADPISGDRATITVHAVRGLGDALVGGEVIGEQWRMQRQNLERVPNTAPSVLTATQADRVVALAAQVAATLDAGPQDIEWAIAGDQIFLLQARPMTALPDEVSWHPPVGRSWMRHFRIGESLNAPVTPLFESWAIEQMERRIAAEQEVTLGMRMRPPQHVVVNGWYFTSPFGAGGPGQMARVLATHPMRLLAIARTPKHPEILERRVVAPLTGRWREHVLPRYRAAVTAGEAQVDGRPTTEQLIGLIDRITDLAGEYLWSIIMVGGFAWKVESTLAAFYRKNLDHRVPGSHQVLLCGLTNPGTLPAHAVDTLDWSHPTVGEGTATAAIPDPARHRAVIAARHEAEAACRAVLKDSPRKRARFEQLLGLAQTYAKLREQQIPDLTLGWPLLRRALLALGQHMTDRGVIIANDDVFFLRHNELNATASLADLVQQRRRAWIRQNRLSPPLTIGEPPAFIKKVMIEAVDQMRTPGPFRDDVLVGMPASPGRATGPVRILTDIEAAQHPDAFEYGDILVTRATTPAWTPLFARAAAIITDAGNLAAHACLVAREYGIPAVVGTGNATTLLRDHATVTVDGSRGIVEPADEPPRRPKTLHKSSEI